MSSGAQLVLETGGLAGLCSRQQTRTHTETHTRCARDTLCQATTFASYKPQREAEAKEGGQDGVFVRRGKIVASGQRGEGEKKKRVVLAV